MGIEIEAAEPIIVEYTVRITDGELSAINRIIGDWVNNHSGMPHYEEELRVSREFLSAYRDKDRV